jgi:integrase
MRVAIGRCGVFDAYATINRMIAALYGFYCYHAAVHGTANPLIKVSDGRINSIFKGMLTHTRQNNYVSGSLFKVKQSAYRIHLFTEDEIELLESVLPTNRDKLIFRLLLGTGARIGELLNLELRNVPVPNEASKVSIMHQVISKGGMRDIFIPAVLLEELDEFILNERARINPDHDWVFYSQNKLSQGSKLKYRAIYDVFKRAGKQIGLDFRFHDTRHTFITSLIESDMDISVVRIIAGHKHVTTTQNYVTLSNRYLTESLSDYWSQSTLLKRGDGDAAL